MIDALGIVVGLEQERRDGPINTAFLTRLEPYVPRQRVTSPRAYGESHEADVRQVQVVEQDVQVGGVGPALAVILEIDLDGVAVLLADGNFGQERTPVLWQKFC
jgi:hypothetical protein